MHFLCKFFDQQHKIKLEALQNYEIVLLNQQGRIFDYFSNQILIFMTLILPLVSIQRNDLKLMFKMLKQILQLSQIHIHKNL